MEELYVEGLATHDGPESCVDVPRGRGEALTGARAGRAIEPRNRRIGVPTLAELAEFYDVPTAQLLPQHPTAATGGDRTLRIDLHRLAALPAQHVGPLARYASAARSNDDDSADGILTLREQDLQCLPFCMRCRPTS